MSDTKILPAVQAGIAGNCNIIYEWHGDDIIGFGRVPTEYRDLVIEAINNQAQLATVTRERDEARAERDGLRSFVEDVATQFDCDLDAHKYGTQCRQCDAQELLAAAIGEQTK